MKWPCPDFRNQLAVTQMESAEVQETSFRISSLQAKIWTWDLSNMKAEHNTLNCDVWCYAGNNTSTRSHSVQMNNDTDNTN